MTPHKSTISIAASLILALGMLSGCSASDSSYYGKVTAINGNELTLELGTMPDRDNPPPINKDGQSDDSASNTNTDKQDSKKNRPGGRPPRGEFGFASTGETKTVTLSDSTKITRQSRGQEETASADDIAVGSIIRVTGNKTASSIVIQGGMRKPDDGEVPEPPNEQSNSEDKQSSSEV